MKKILVIDNTIDLPHGSPEIRHHLESVAKEVGAVEITVVRGPDSAIPKDLSGFDGVVLSGSKTRINDSAPWIDDEMEAIRKLHALKIPTFGICYGEQLIVRAMGGEHHTNVAKVAEHGWVEVEVDPEAELFAGLPKKFYTFEYHKDEVTTLPKGFQLKGSSPSCPVQAYTLEDAPMWGVQFHPERGLEEGNRSLDRRLKEDPNFPALNRDKAEKVFDPSISRTIFRNFLRLAWKK